MIESIKLLAGSSPEKNPLVVELAPITIFVGPNYSGKSKVLSEISHACNYGARNIERSVLDDVTFTRFEYEKAVKIEESLRIRHPEGAIPQQGNSFYYFNGRNIGQASQSYISESLQDPNGDKRTTFAGYYMNHRTKVLGGYDRIALGSNDQPMGDLQKPPENTFRRLFDDDELRAHFSKLIYKAFGRHLVTDPTFPGQIRLRLSPTPPPSPEIERGLSKESVEFHSAATMVAHTSDGAKAFIGILAEIIAGKPDVVLMDEPEAFLHPSLANLLGLEVAQSVASADKRLIASTHSPQFLMGCIQSGVPLNVIRLTYRDGVATARLLPSVELTRLMRDPLLRSTSIIDALFYESVVVTEADSDRAFYQEINTRLRAANPPRGVSNCLFVNAQNKHTIPTILEPLRNLGIPAAAIYDIDFVGDGGGVATKFLRSSGIPALSRDGLNAQRRAVFDALKSKNQKFNAHGGIQLLDTHEANAANDFFDHLASYGAFIVRNGALESWLSNHGVGGHGPGWLIQMFEKMGLDPSTSDYVHPELGDVWEFMDSVASWLTDPKRKGIPT